MPSSASATSAAPVAAIQRSAGIVFIHSMSAKPASSGGAKAIPHPSSVDEQAVPRPHDGARVGREERDDADDREEQQHERQTPRARSGR